MLTSHPITQETSKQRHGFTLVELLVVIAIIAILSAIVFGLSRGVAVKQANTKAEAELQTLGSALEAYKLKYGDYPWIGADTDGTELYKHLTGALRMKATGNGTVTYENADGVPFIDSGAFTTAGSNSEKYIIDPWGQPYRYYYRNSSNGNSWSYPTFILMSVGPDGQTASGSSNLARGDIRSSYFEEGGANAYNLDNLVYGVEF
ncbi:prepilin-type N-terminal cleavage/methylation domain-containing protein [Cerasicoccus fimbriatus]|uniref:prepilin-type N-terminal cleavage/methylation domain-containing protein n=1 Tax=Cerasicoccus fimbriatus TaxID=3014554 RepID=UPI0022B41DE5|nr:prepilin-type N-terminal cleavage/methylation domain-containing protein [Cerasicoccus sp. TK19100]